jgi:hypothetical protein
MSRPDDLQVVETQIGRPVRAPARVVSRCHLGLPVVIEVPPHLDDGTPFPTLFWLTCPLAQTRIGRLEGAGGVKRMENRAEVDSDFAARLESAHESYRSLRDGQIEEGASSPPTGGVGGARAGVKCLHAHYAHTRAGGDNPVGDLVQAWIEPLDCLVPCVVGDGYNPEWVNRQ